MEINSIGKNYGNLNIASQLSSTAGKTNGDKGLDNFTTVEWKNKNDGKTYVAKKITLKENGKEITGVFVFDKEAKPNEQGKIDGEFMSFDTFMKKMGDELPVVNSSMAKAYFPNISVKTLEAKAKDLTSARDLGAEFEESFNSSVKLSNGSVILKPSIEGSSNDIKQNDNGNYILTSRPAQMGAEAKTSEITEDEIIGNKSLCGGTIKKLDDNKYEVTYYTESSFKDKNTGTVILDANECAVFMQKHLLSTYKI